MFIGFVFVFRSEKVAKNLASRLLVDLEARLGRLDEPAFNPEVQYGFMKRQIGIHKVFCLASLLDPRFKKLGFLKHENDEESIWNALKEEMLKVIDDNTFDFKDTTTDENIINISEAESDSEGDDVLDRYMGRISKGQQQTNGNSRSHEDMIEMELTEYKNAWLSQNFLPKLERRKKLSTGMVEKFPE